MKRPNMKRPNMKILNKKRINFKITTCIIKNMIIKAQITTKAQITIKIKIINPTITKFKILIIILTNYSINHMTTIPKSPILTLIYYILIIRINIGKIITMFHKNNYTSNNYI